MEQGIQLAVSLDDDGTPQIDKITKSVDNLGKQSKRTKKTFTSSMKSMSGAAGKLLKTVGKLATSMPAMLGAAGGMAGMGMLVKQGLAFNGELESIETQFKVILGSAKAARDVMADIVKFSAETPFQLAEVARAGKMLEAFGLGGIENLKLVGDAAAAAGRPIEEIAMVFGRIKAGAFGEAFMRLAETGLATRDMLESAGLVFDRGGAYVGSAEQAMAAVKDIVATRYGGMMKEMANTWGGAMSTMKDNWNLLIGALTKPAFEVLKPRITAVTDILVKWKESRYLDTIAKNGAIAIDGFIESIVSAVKWINVWGGTIATTAQSVAFAVGTIYLITEAVELWGKRQAILNVIMKANPWAIAAVAVAALIPWILKGVKALGGWGVVWAYIVAGAKSGWAYMKGMFSSIAAGVEWMASVWWNYFLMIMEVNQGIGIAFMDGMTAVVEIVDRAGANIISFFKDLGKGIYKAITFQFDDMEDAFQSAGDTITQGWADNVDSLYHIGDDAWEGVGDKFGKLIGATSKKGFMDEWNSAMDEAGDSAGLAMADARAKMDAALTSAAGPVAATGAPGGGYAGPVDAFIPEAAASTERAGDAAVEQFYRIQAKSEEFVEYQKELWGGWAGDFVDVWQTGFSDAFGAAILDGQHLQESLDEIWQGMKGSFIQMTMDMATAWIGSKIKMGIASILFEKKTTAASVAGSGARATATATETAVTQAGIGTDVAGAAGKTFKAHAGIPFVGAMIAISLIGLMLATMGGLGGKRTGGMIPGYGSGNEDNQAWNLSAGEFVQPKGAVDYYGAGFMEAIRTKTFNPATSAAAPAPAYVPVNVDQSMTVVVDAGGGGGYNDDVDIAAEVEDALGPILERLTEQRRLKFSS